MPVAARSHAIDKIVVVLFENCSLDNVVQPAPDIPGSSGLDGVAGSLEILARRDPQDPSLGRGDDRPAKALVCQYGGDLLGGNVGAKRLRAGLRDLPHRAV